MDISSYSALAGHNQESARVEDIQRQLSGAEDEADFGIKLEQKLQSTPEQRDKRLKDLCEDMEGVFLNILVKQMRKTVPESKDGIFHGGHAEEVWQEQLDSKYADLMAKEQGIGLAETMYEQLSAK